MFLKHLIDCQALHVCHGDTMEGCSQKLRCLCWWVG